MGLIDTNTGLKFGDGLIWLDGGLGGEGLDIEAGTPPWVLVADDVPATLDINFLTNQAYNAPASVSIASLLTCTRATPALASYTNAFGQLIYFAPNTLRYGTNGLLVEEARTNVLRGSADFTNLSRWDVTQSAVVTSSVLAPDGTSTAFRLTPNTAAATRHYMRSVSIGTDCADVAYSVFAKSDGSALGVFVGDNGVGARGYFTLSGAGTATGVGSNVASIEALANGWYRCKVSLVGANIVSANDVWIGGAMAGSDNFTGNGVDSVYLWGAQLEPNAFITSYIPTTTVAVTRAADTVSMATSSIGGFANKPGSMVASGLSFATASLHYLWTLDQNTADQIYSNGTVNRALYVRSGASTVADLSPNAGVTPNTLFKQGAAWADNDFAAVFNGGAASTDASGTSPTGLVTLYLGANVSDSATARLDGYITRLSYWNTRVPNASLQTLTT
jgi:hypothetical protein